MGWIAETPTQELVTVTDGAESLKAVAFRSINHGKNFFYKANIHCTFTLNHTMTAALADSAVSIL